MGLIDTSKITDKITKANTETIARIVSVEINKLKPSEKNFYTLSDIELLKESIVENGQIEPITITEDFEIISGHRRYTACKELNFEIIKAVIISDVSDIEKEMLLIEANRQRVKTEEDKLIEFQKMKELVKKKKEEDPNYKGKTLELIAEKMGVSHSTAKRLAKKEKERNEGSREPLTVYKLSKDVYEEKRKKVMDKIKRLDKKYAQEREKLEKELTEITNEQYSSSFVQVTI